MKRNRLPLVLATLAITAVGVLAAWMTEVPRIIQGACNAPDGTQYELAITVNGPAQVDIDETAVFTVDSGGRPIASYAWTATGPAVPATGSDPTFSPKWSEPGKYEVTCNVVGGDNAVNGPCDANASTEIEVKCPTLDGATIGTFAFGFAAPAAPLSDLPDADGFCSYSVDNASLTLKTPHASFTIPDIPLTDITLSFKYNPTTGVYKDITASWAKPGGPTRTIGPVTVTVTSLTMTLSSPGYTMSGTLGLQVSLAADVSMGNTVYLRSGMTGPINISYVNALASPAMSSVTWDFGGVTGIHVDICAPGTGGATQLLELNPATLNSAGLLSGTVNALPAGANYITPSGFNINVPPGSTATVQWNIWDPTTIQILTLNANAKISGITGLTGDIVAHVVYSSTAGMSATANLSEAGSIRFCNMELTDAILNLDFDLNFNVTKVEGQLSANHTDFDAKIVNVQFKVLNGSLDKFHIDSATMAWKKFDFNITQADYVAGTGFKCLGAELNVATYGNISLSHLYIDTAGTIQIGNLSGTINKSPLSGSFSASYGVPVADQFKGTFNCTIGSTSGSYYGDVIFGNDGGASGYTYAYFNITARVNVHLGSSGLSLTQIDGEIGYNYNVSTNDAIAAGVPQQGTHRLGAGVVLKDSYGLATLGAGFKLDLGGSTIATLNGDVQVTSGTKYFGGAAVIKYDITQNQVEGDVVSYLKIPESGKVLDFPNNTLKFKMAGGSWYMQGSGAGKFFDDPACNASGNFSLNSTFADPIGSMNGNLNGTLNLIFTRNFTYPDTFVGVSSCADAYSKVSWFGFGCNIDINFSVNASTTLWLDDTGITGSLNVYANGSANGPVKFPQLLWTSGCANYFTTSIGVAGNLTCTVPTPNKFHMVGNLTISYAAETTTKAMDYEFTY